MRVKSYNNTFDIRFRYDVGTGPTTSALEYAQELRADIKALQEELEFVLADIEASKRVTTSVSITNEATGDVYEGVAYKHPKDQHRRSAARAEALASATSTLPPALRSHIFNAWMNRPDGYGRL